MTSTIDFKQPDALGFYGEFGGAFIPELLRPNVEELEYSFHQMRESALFQKEFHLFFFFFSLFFLRFGLLILRNVNWPVKKGLGLLFISTGPLTAPGVIQPQILCRNSILKAL